MVEDEKNELYDVDMNLEDEIKDFNPKKLSLEQWSFIKSLYPSINELTFMKLYPL